MGIEKIRAKITNIKKIYSEDPNTSSAQFTDGIVLAYTKAVLNKLNKFIHDTDSDKIIENIKLLLKENWDLVKGSLLSYTAIPEKEITQLLLDLTEYVVEKDANLAPISILMPNVFCDSLFLEQYPNLDELNITQLRTVIKTHVLSQNHAFLIPISLLTKEDYVVSKINFPNVYFDLDGDPLSEYLTNEELNLLANHSSEAKAIWDARHQYKNLLENKATLLGQLNILSRALIQNSNKGKGQEEDAGKDIYSAIINFNGYWQKVSDHNIPSQVLSEIQKLLNLAAPQEQEKEKNKNRNHRNLIDTCLATRRKGLENSIAGHEEILDAIGLTHEQKESQIIEVKEKLQKATENLRKSLENNTYSGQEQRGITIKILHDLTIGLRFNDLNGLADALKNISVHDVKAICALEGAQEKIVAIISNIENFVILTIELNNEILKALLDGIKDNIMHLIPSCKDLLALLISLDLNQCAAVVKALKDQLPTIIKNAYDFRDVFEFLTLEQRTVVFEALKDHLPTIIKNGSDLGYALKFLTLEQCSVVFEALKDQLPTIIKNGSGLGCALKFLTLEQRSVVFEALKDQLPTIIKNAYYFRHAFEFLTLEQRSVVFEALKDQLPSFVKITYDFNKIFRYLTPEQCTIMVEMLKDRLLSCINNLTDFSSISSSLTSDQCKAVYNPLKEQLFSIKQCLIKYETQLDKSSQNTNNSFSEADDIQDYLQQVISQFRNFIEKNTWNTKGIHLFKRAVPDGIQKLRNVLADNDLDNFEKLKKLSEIITYKCKNTPYFRKAITNNFYRELSVIFQSVDKPVEVSNERQATTNYYM
ncbi:MAG TPA: hypothetical protein VGH95_04005 [Candidatus Aquirickettsiella sp.]